jgi:PAS domain S-box-containing protein
MAAVNDQGSAAACGEAGGSPRPGAAGNLYQAIFENMAVGCAHGRLIRAQGIPVDWVCLEANRAFAECSPLTHPAGRLATEALPGIRESCPELFAALVRVASSGRPESCTAFVPVPGAWVYLHASSPAPDEFVATCTAAGVAQQELRLIEERLNLALAASGMGTFDWDIPRDRRHFDAAFHRLVGLEADALDGGEAGFYRVIHPDDRAFVRASLARAQATGDFETEYRVIWPDGSVHHIAAKGRVLQDAQGQPLRLNGVAWDITGRIQAEADQRRFEERAHRAQAMEALGNLVAGVAHILNNVLAVALGTASLGEAQATQSEHAADLEAYRTIGKVCQRGKEVVQSLIQFSQPTLAGQAPFDLQAVVREVVVLLGNTTRKHIRIVEALAETPMWVHGTAGSLNLALVNLCFNALEAMPDGGTLTLRTADPGDGRVEVYVEDTGRGMTEAVRQHMLEPFFTTKDKSIGAGLGLSMVYGVVKAHQGTLEISSRPGEGTSVQLRFPRIPDPALVEPSRLGAQAAQAPACGLGRVLLVDDEDDVLVLVRRMLDRAGVAQVVTARRGEEALELLEAGLLPDLVILDQNMPGMTGVQAMTRIRALHPALPILFSSGQPDLAGWTCLRQGGVAVLSKPFTINEFREALDRLRQA